MNLFWSLEQAFPDKNQKSLTPFGELSRYLLVVAVDLYAVDAENAEAEARILSLKEKAFNLIDKQALLRMKCPKDILSRDMDSESIYEVYATGLRRWYRDHIKENTDVPSIEKKLFVRSLSFMEKSIDTPLSGIRNIERLVQMISPTLSKLFNDVVRLQKGTSDSVNPAYIKDLYKKLRGMVKSLTGSEGMVIPVEQSRKLRQSPTSASRLKEFRTLRGTLKDLYDAALSDITNNGPLAVDVAAKKLKDHGFEDINFPVTKSGFKGYVGMVNGKLTLFTENQDALSMAVPANAKIRMNENYVPDQDNTYVLAYQPIGAKGETRVYTNKYRAQATTSKYAKVEANTVAVQRWVATWKRDLMAKDPMKYVPAAAAYILYTTGARVGSRKVSASKTGAGPTYGITTLRTQHVKLATGKITISYVGKKGVNQTHVIKVGGDRSMRKVYDILKELLDGKKKGELVFAFPRSTSRTGAIQELNPPFFRGYLKSTGMTLTAHKLRHLRGTALAKDMLAKHPWHPPAKAKTLTARQRDAESYIKNKVISPVADLLGHRSKSGGKDVLAWRTSIGSYIVPTVISEWFKSQNLEVPKWANPKGMTEE